MRPILPVFAVLLTALMAAAVACGGGDNKKPDPTPGPTETPSASGPVEQALKRHVETTLQRPFVADCSLANPTNDVNKVCAAARGQRGNQRAYAIGQTFSEFFQWVILEERSGQWTVVSTSPINADTAGIPGVPWPLRTGVDLVVAGAAPCVNVRLGPTINQAAVDCIADGTKVRLTAGPTAADGINWWQVEGRTGWVAGDYLRYPDALN